VNPYVAEWDDRPGLTVDEKTLPELDGADGVVVFWSESGRASDRVNMEYDRALLRGIPIVLLLYDGVDRPASWGDRIYLRVEISRDFFGRTFVSPITRLRLVERVTKYAFEWLAGANRRARGTTGPVPV